MKKTATVLLLVVFAVSLAAVLLRVRPWQNAASKEPGPETYPQDGIEPGYTLYFPVVETNTSGVAVTLNAVVSGKLTRVGLDSLARRLSVEARKVAPDAAAFRVRLYASEDDRLAGGETALVQFEYRHDGEHAIRFHDQRLTALEIPPTAPELLSENQRRTIFLTLVRAESFGDASNRAAAAKAVAGRYGLKPEDLQPIREEGQRKQWGGAHLSRSKEDTP